MLCPKITPQPVQNPVHEPAVSHRLFLMTDISSNVANINFFICLVFTGTADIFAILGWFY